MGSGFGQFFFRLVTYRLLLAECGVGPADVVSTDTSNEAASRGGRIITGGWAGHAHREAAKSRAALIG